MATTEIYVHALEEVNRDTAEAMDSIVTELRKPRRPRRSSQPERLAYMRYLTVLIRTWPDSVTKLNCTGR